MNLTAAQRRLIKPTATGFGHAVLPTGACVTFYAQVHTVSESNARGHWRRRHCRTKAQREAVALAMGGMPLPSLPVNVKLTRIATRLLDKGDNLPVAMKACRDQVAAEYGVDDGGDSIVWDYDQHVSLKVPQCVRIHIQPIGQGGGNG
jgi:hypothetical protein